MQLKLFFAPGSCSRVSMVALEEIGEPFETELVMFMKGAHKAPEYLAMNPAGKVPVLLVNGQPLSQTVAILTFLARSFPEADLLPLGKDAFSDAQLLRDLIWCSSDLHPLVTRLRLPTMFCDLSGAPDRVFEMAEVLMTTQLQQVERRLSRQPWMLGERWSMVDRTLRSVNGMLADVMEAGATRAPVSAATASSNSAWLAAATMSPPLRSPPPRQLPTTPLAPRTTGTSACQSCGLRPVSATRSIVPAARRA